MASTTKPMLDRALMVAPVVLASTAAIVSSFFVPTERKTAFHAISSKPSGHTRAHLQGSGMRLTYRVPTRPGGN
jgi:hypothetical protein